MTLKQILIVCRLLQKPEWVCGLSLHHASRKTRPQRMRKKIFGMCRNKISTPRFNPFLHLVTHQDMRVIYTQSQQNDQVPDQKTLLPFPQSRSSSLCPFDSFFISPSCSGDSRQVNQQTQNPELPCKGFTEMKETWTPRNFTCSVSLGWFSLEGILTELIVRWEQGTAVLNCFPN